MLQTLRKPLWRLLLLLLIPGLLFFAWCPVSAAANTHHVAPGETLFLIARKYNTTVAELVKANGIANPSLIYPGQVLTVPDNIHIVQKGETLWIISQKYGTSLPVLIAANPGISPHNIYPGQKIKIPVPGTASGAGGALPSREGRDFNTKYSQQDIDLFARLVHSEAAGEPYVGQVAVAATILNRVASPRYPNTIPGVIYQIADGYYQYSPVLDGRINIPANKTAYQAVYDALGGWDPSKNALGFYNPSKTSNQWVRQQQVTTVIGNHIFFR
jgi:N-acetylmuramoyl-L-alanine amidase